MESEAGVICTLVRLPASALFASKATFSGVSTSGSGSGFFFLNWNGMISNYVA
jgi:hypothetical protein